MADFRGAARQPGSLGVTDFLNAGFRGPLGFGQVNASQQGSTQAKKTFGMPAPTKIGRITRAKSVSWKLSKNKEISPLDVQQGQLSNCPVPAILAALANTKDGRKRLDGLITEYVNTSSETTLTNEIVVALSESTKDDSDYKKQVKTIASTRYFEVKLAGTYPVSDVFYVLYSDRDDVDMIYMDSPSESLWPCVIEKAYASKLGGYEELDNVKKHTANEYWEVLAGAPAKQLTVDASTGDGTILAIAKAADKVPAMAASQDNATVVTGHHGFAVLGVATVKDEKTKKAQTGIKLYNPHGGAPQALSLDDVRASFKAILHGSPK